VHFSELLERARCWRDQNCPAEAAGPEQDARALGDLLLRAYAGGIVEFTVAPARLARQVSERPVASPLARLQSRHGDEIVNLRHFNLKLEDSLSRFLLPLLDGSRDVELLLEEAVSLLRSGDAALQGGDGAIVDPEEARPYLRGRIEAALGEFAEMALLVA
jgi:hypothetical protein